MDKINIENLTLEEIQTYLDKKKLCDSEFWKRDLSGIMNYCRKCEFRNFPHLECTISHPERVERCACAIAFVNMQKEEERV